jgi:hypothetical protein
MFFKDPIALGALKGARGRMRLGTHTSIPSSHIHRFFRFQYSFCYIPSPTLSSDASDAGAVEQFEGDPLMGSPGPGSDADSRAPDTVTLSPLVAAAAEIPSDRRLSLRARIGSACASVSGQTGVLRGGIGVRFHPSLMGPTPGSPGRQRPAGLSVSPGRHRPSLPPSLLSAQLTAARFADQLAMMAAGGPVAAAAAAPVVPGGATDVDLLALRPDGSTRTALSLCLGTCDLRKSVVVRSGAATQTQAYLAVTHAAGPLRTGAGTGRTHIRRAGRHVVRHRIGNRAHLACVSAAAQPRPVTTAASGGGG